MNIDHSKFEYSHEMSMGEEKFGVRAMIPYEEKERMAQDLVGATMIFDEELGLAYEGYNAELIRTFLILVHYTDLDLTQLDNPEGRSAVYDAVTSHGLWESILDIVDADVCCVDRIAMYLEDSARKTFEQKHSLAYRLGKTFASFLGTEDLMETIAKAEGLNTKLIDMLEAAKEKKARGEIGGVSFAKKRSE